MSSDKVSSSDRLLLAAIDLIAERGYNGVTTQEIAAAAGLSEKTLFRHFGSKQNLLESAFDRFHYTEEMKKLFNEKLIWDLETDLTLLSRMYHAIMNKNRKMIMISIKEEGNLPGLRIRTQKHPQQLMEILTSYFTVMSDKGKLLKTNPQIQAFSFLMLNFGIFMNNLEADGNFPGIALDDVLEESVRVFARALTP